MNAPALRALSIGEILDTAFVLYRRDFAQMVLATGLFILPLLVIEAVVPLGYLAIVDRIGNIFVLAATAAVVLIASERYMGRSLDAMSAMRRVGDRFLSVWGAAFFQGLIVGIGFVLLVIPGIIALAYTFAMQQAVMIEGATAGDSWERSKSLAEDNFWRIAGTSIVAFVIVFTATVAMGMFAAQYYPDPRWGLIATNLFLVLLHPFGAVVGTVLYYDLRIRKEGYDVQVMAEQLGGTPAPARFAFDGSRRGRVGFR
jgi:uncharacterized membrane protein